MARTVVCLPPTAQTDRQTGRQTDRQKQRQTDRNRDRQTKRLAWPGGTVSQHTDTSENAKAVLYIKILLCADIIACRGLIFSHGKLLAPQHPPSTHGDKSPSEDAVWLPLWQVLRKTWSHRQSSHPIECINLSVYNGVYLVTPRALCWRMLQQQRQQQHQKQI